MHNSKLVAHLKLLKAEELKRFFSFLRSPYYTQSKDVIRLFKLIRKYYPTFLSKHLQKESLFKKMYPNETYSDIKLRNLQSKLNKILEAYLIQISFEKNEFEKKKKLAQVFRERNYYSGFRRNIMQLLAQLEAKPHRDANYFFEKYSLFKNLYFHEETLQNTKSLPSLKETMSTLENFYAIERLYLGIDLKNREHIFSEKHDFNFEDYSYKPPKDNLTFNLYRSAYQLLDRRGKEDYETLKKSLDTKISSLKKETAEVIYYLLLNFATQNFQGEPNFYLKELFLLSKFGLKTGTVTLNDTFYLNTVIYAAVNQEFTWAQHFIEEQENAQNSVISPYIRRLARGQLFFNSGDYHNVIEVLKDFDTQNILYLLSAKFIIFRSLFKLMEQDTSYFLTTMAYADAFERFLTRTKSINQQKKQRYLKFIRLIRKIIKLREKEELITPALLVKMAGKPSSIAGFNWLKKNL